MSRAAAASALEAADFYGKRVQVKRSRSFDFTSIENFPNVEEGLKAEQARKILGAHRVAAGFFKFCVDIPEVREAVDEMEPDEFKSVFGINAPNKEDDVFSTLEDSISMKMHEPDAKAQKIDNDNSYAVDADAKDVEAKDV
jgi:hypothetical protein